MRLATFVHVSDTHLGEPAIADEDARMSLWMNLPILDGLLGHSHASLVLLDEFYADLRDTEDARLLFTGDLTAAARNVEFEFGSQYFGDRAAANEYLGLAVPDWNDSAVPGNHDHWPGTGGIFGGPTTAVTTYFRQMPYIAPADELGGGISLRFIFVDTDADVHPNGAARFLGQGDFRKRLPELRESLPPRDEAEVRVLCLHHSQVPRRRPWLRMDPACRMKLDEFIVATGIDVLLCGHLHSPPAIREFDAQSADKSARVLECQCGTTAQRTPLLNRALKQLRMPNSLMVHRIIREGVGLSWETEVFLQTPNGFRSAPARHKKLQKHRFELLRD